MAKANKGLWDSLFARKIKASPAKVEAAAGSNHRGEMINNQHDSFHASMPPGKYGTAATAAITGVKGISLASSAANLYSILGHVPFPDLGVFDPAHIFDHVPDIFSPIEKALHNGVFVLGVGALLFVSYEAFSY